MWNFANEFSDTSSFEWEVVSKVFNNFDIIMTSLKAGHQKFNITKTKKIMLPTERASKLEQTLPKDYSLKINHLRYTKRKKCQTRGLCQFLVSYDYNTKNILLLTFTINFFILLQHYTFLLTRLTYFRH